MATPQQAVYNLQRAADFFNDEGNNAIITGIWTDDNNKPISIDTDTKLPITDDGEVIYPITCTFGTGIYAKKIGIQAPPKTKFSLVGITGATNMIIGRSGTYEIELESPSIEGITFDAPEVIFDGNISTDNINNAKIKLQKLKFIFEQNLSNSVINSLDYYYKYNDTNLGNIEDPDNDDVYTWVAGVTKAQQNFNTQDKNKYWDRYNEVYQAFSTAYKNAYLDYKRALYGTYTVANKELSNVIVDYM